MGFIQIVELKTDRYDEMEKLQQEYESRTEGSRTHRRVNVTKDRDRDGYYLIVVEFPSYDEAMKNSALPGTTHFAEQIAKLCDEPPKFYNLDVVHTTEG